MNKLLYSIALTLFSFVVIPFLLLLPTYVLPETELLSLIFEPIGKLSFIVIMSWVLLFIILFINIITFSNSSLKLYSKTGREIFFRLFAILMLANGMFYLYNIGSQYFRYAREEAGMGALYYVEQFLSGFIPFSIYIAFSLVIFVFIFSKTKRWLSLE